MGAAGVHGEIEGGRGLLHFHYPLSRRAAEEWAQGGGRGGFSHRLGLDRVKALAHAYNQSRPSPVSVGDLCAVGLIHRAAEAVTLLYRRTRNPSVWSRGWDRLTEWEEHPVHRSAQAFLNLFPPPLGGESPREIPVEAAESPIPSPEVLEPMLLLAVAGDNPAFSPFLPLFDSAALDGTGYEEGVARLEGFLKTEPPFGSRDLPLHEMLREPARAHPHSLQDQVDFIRRHWGRFLPEELRFAILRGMDLLSEETVRFLPGPGPASSPLDFAVEAGEEERFSPDQDWMPRLVLMAKSVYVWLHQLSLETGREVRRLDEIPDTALDRLAGWGFTGLWLIGLWERSPASQEIKRRMGNPEAMASAYAVHEYEIAEDLGGEKAFRTLRDRAGARGIRLAGDMVPNHMGLSSGWVVDHPERFLGRPDAPYPWYEFQGPDLCGREDVSIRIEDRYWDRSDAAVVFERREKGSGDVRYLYHGNDGTGMPWNDTAQLDYLNPEVRKAVLETVLKVAEKFPVIRFDAAMTLTKRHFQRLWYPPEGEGGAIPTRAECGVSRREFHKRFPVEFWREVVDAVAERAPDTLLLAEAFWLMEGYFVRTLGMHRVYNSAFMNMLKLEDNAKYRTVLKDVLRFDPEILRRFANFMNNPDEDTARAQFGRDDKYFGAALLLVTLPGLPLFGHGQIEGLEERYGMEYSRAYRDEQPDEDLVARHEREIFPLLRRRDLFAGVTHFRLFDFLRPDGTVNEDVFAYVNGNDRHRVLVVVHNRYAEASGRVAPQSFDGSSLWDALNPGGDPEDVLCLLDQRSGLTFLFSADETVREGLPLHLGAYDARVFWEMRLWRGRTAMRVHKHLDGRGVKDPEQEARRLLCASALSAIGNALQAAPDWEVFEPAWEQALGEIGEIFPPPPHAEETSHWLGERFKIMSKSKLARGRKIGSAGLALWALGRLVDPGGEGVGRVWEACAGSEERAGFPSLAWLVAGNLDLDRMSPAVQGTLELLLEEEATAQALGFNEHDGVLWFRREPYEELVKALGFLAALHGTGTQAAEQEIEDLLRAGEEGKYQVQALKERLRPSGSTRPSPEHPGPDE